MKKILFLIAMMIGSGSVYAAEPTPPAETKRVCIKDNNGKETCKIVKVHKKLDGTKVPEPNKK
jgi:hypothetical protein